MLSKWTKEKENLELMILEQNLSYELIGRYYNCSGTTIKNVALQLGIKLLKRRKINNKETFNKDIKKEYYCINCGKLLNLGNTNNFKHKYCSNKCLGEYKHKLGYLKILEGDLSIMRANYNPREYKADILKELGNVCAICNMEPQWNGKPLVFILDHIDGHASNNRRSNLRLICPNCDSQLDTYKSKNKCGERSYYRYNKLNRKE